MEEIEAKTCPCYPPSNGVLVHDPIWKCQYSAIYVSCCNLDLCWQESQAILPPPSGHLFSHHQWWNTVTRHSHTHQQTLYKGPWRSMDMISVYPNVTGDTRNLFCHWWNLPKVWHWKMWLSCKWMILQYKNKFWEIKTLLPIILCLLIDHMCSQNQAINYLKSISMVPARA